MSGLRYGHSQEISARGRAWSIASRWDLIHSSSGCNCSLQLEIGINFACAAMQALSQLARKCEQRFVEFCKVGIETVIASLPTRGGFVGMKAEQRKIFR